MVPFTKSHSVKTVVLTYYEVSQINSIQWEFASLRCSVLEAHIIICFGDQASSPSPSSLNVIDGKPTPSHSFLISFLCPSVLFLSLCCVILTHIVVVSPARPVGK